MSSNYRDDEIRTAMDKYHRDMRHANYSPIPFAARTWQRRLRDVRFAAGLTQAAAGRLMGIRRGEVCEMERDLTRTYVPYLTTIRKIRALETRYAHHLALYLSEPWRYARRRIVIRNGNRYETHRTAPNLAPLDTLHLAGRQADTGSLAVVENTRRAAPEITAWQSAAREIAGRTRRYHRAIEAYYHHTYVTFTNQRRLEGRAEQLVSEVRGGEDSAPGDTDNTAACRRELADDQAGGVRRSAA